MKEEIKQHDMRDCGAACLASIAAHYHYGISIARVRQYASTDKYGTNVLGLIRAAEKLGFEAKGVRGNVDALPHIPYPAIAHVIRHADNQELHHYVVLYGYKNGTVKMMDPGIGDMQSMTIEAFKAEWSGVLVLMEPSEHFFLKNEKISIWSRFFSLVKPHRSAFLQAFFGAVCYTVLGLSSSIYIEKVTDYVLVGGNTNLLNLLSVMMLVILAFQIFISSYQGVIVLRTGQMIDARLILGYYKHLLRLPQSFFDTMQVGEITSRINDAVKIRNFINSTAMRLLVNALIVVLSFLLMFGYYWKLALIMLAVIPFYAAIYMVFDRWNKRVERKVMENAASLESQLVESLNAEKTIKQFGIEDFENECTENRFVRLLYSIYSSVKAAIFSANSSDFISRLFTIILIWVGSYFVIDGEITPGELMSFYALVGFFTSPAASLIEANKSVREAMIAADRLFEIMDLEREEETDKIQLSRESVGDIVFSDVSFAYGTRREIFKNFNLTIHQGEMIAIVGESGSGKSTLANLLQNLYPVNSGKITIGGLELKYLSTESVRHLISAVPQQITLFSGSVIENIAIGEYEPDVKKILNLSQILGLEDFINSLPEGFNTYIGENGSMLSGGQKQRLAIARALYKDPEILILDEATSALDSVSEQYVQKVLSDFIQRKKTVIVIAHRLSTIRSADNVVVLRDGEVVESGRFENLLKNNGELKRLWKLQNFSAL